MTLIPPSDLITDEPQLCLAFNPSWRPYLLGLLDQGANTGYWQSDEDIGIQGILGFMVRLMEASQENCDMVRLPRVIEDDLTGAGDMTVSSTGTPTFYAPYSKTLEFTVYEEHAVRFDYAFDFRASSAGTNSYLNCVLNLTNVADTFDESYYLGRHLNNSSVFASAVGGKAVLLPPDDYVALMLFYRTNANVILQEGTARGLWISLYDAVP